MAYYRQRGRAVKATDSKSVTLWQSISCKIVDESQPVQSRHPLESSHNVLVEPSGWQVRRWYLSCSYGNRGSRNACRNVTLEFGDVVEVVVPSPRSGHPQVQLATTVRRSLRSDIGDDLYFDEKRGRLTARCMHSYPYRSYTEIHPLVSAANISSVVALPKRVDTKTCFRPFGIFGKLLSDLRRSDGALEHRKNAPKGLLYGVHELRVPLFIQLVDRRGTGGQRVAEAERKGRTRSRTNASDPGCQRSASSDFAILRRRASGTTLPDTMTPCDAFGKRVGGIVGDGGVGEASGAQFEGEAGRGSLRDQSVLDPSAAEEGKEEKEEEAEEVEEASSALRVDKGGGPGLKPSMDENKFKEVIMRSSKEVAVVEEEELVEEGYTRNRSAIFKCNSRESDPGLPRGRR
ncbi:hypothetical protein DFJ73DRAFT_755624 [Zopfochytrium polystomum]|nr:hypothetical protein DFJ73DRAFT_755624 [Zopfochytrium polystomum]